MPHSANHSRARTKGIEMSRWPVCVCACLSAGQSRIRMPRRVRVRRHVRGHGQHPRLRFSSVLWVLVGTVDYSCDCDPNCVRCGY